MIGKVLEGRYLGANINKLPDKNVLYIETEDGNKIALSKKNVISIDDVTAEYPGKGKKVMMVLWNDFETSIVQIGAANVAQKEESIINSPAPVPTHQDNSIPSAQAELIQPVQDTTPTLTSTTNDTSGIDVIISGKHSGCRIKRDTERNIAFTVPHFISLTKNNVDHIDVINSANTPVGNALKGAIVAGAVGALVASSTITEILVEIVWKDGQTSIARVSKEVFEAIIVGIRKVYSEEQLKSLQKQREEKHKKEQEDAFNSKVWSWLIAIGWLVLCYIAGQN